MIRPKKILTFAAGTILFLTASSAATPVLADTIVPATSQSKVQLQAKSKGFVHHIWYQTTYYHETRPYVFVTVSRGNEAFRGYIQRRYTTPSGHGPTGVVYGGYLYNTKLKSYPIPTLNKKLPKPVIEMISNNEK